MRIINWRLWAALAVSGLFLLFLFFRVDREEMLAALRDANYIYVIPALGLYFVAVYFRSLRWRYLLSPVGAFPIQRLYPVIVIGYMANNLLPARLGELVRAYYLAKRENVSASTALATVAVERVYDGVALLAFAAFAGSWLLLIGAFDRTGDVYRNTALVLIAGTVAIFLAALLFLTMASLPGSLRLVDLGLTLVPNRLRPSARDLARRFITGLSILRSPRQHLAVFMLSLPVWLLEGAMYLLVSSSFGLHEFFESFWVLVLAMMLLTATSNLVTALPASVGGIGPFEVVAQQTLVAMGVSASLGAPYALFLHLVALWLPVTLAGLVLLWWQNLSLRRLVEPPEASAAEPPETGYSRAVPAPNEETP